MAKIVDRFEGKYAVVEIDGSRMENIPRNLLPKDCKEGDVIEMIGGRYILNLKEKARLKEEIEDLAKNLWE